LLPAYDSLGQPVVGLETLSWCSPESTYLVPTSDGPATGFFPLQSGTASVYPGLGAMLHWPTPASSFSLMGVVPSEDPWPVETDSDGCSLFSSVDAPSPRASQQYPAVAEFIAMASTAQKKDSSSPKAEQPSPAAVQNKPTTTAKPPAHVRKHSGTIQLRTAARKPRKQAGLGPGSGGNADAAAAGGGGDEDDDDDLTPEERRARRAHNRVEKQYRTRLNAQFERLLAVVMPTPVLGRRHSAGAGVGDATEAEAARGNDAGLELGGVGVGEDDEKRLSKAEVLDLALRRIRALEAERERLDGERGVLVGSMRAAMAVAGVPWFPVGGRGCGEGKELGELGAGVGGVGWGAEGEGWVGGVVG
ncbi:hypothetical protein C8A05DRAFT_19018, partial [Staphylotrichum tortipilum]